MSSDIRDENPENQGFIIYETVDEEPPIEHEDKSEPINEEIETASLAHEAALQHFTDVPTRLNETMKEKISRIHREIQQVRDLGGHKESEDLLAELRNALRVKQLPIKKSKITNADQVEIRGTVSDPDRSLTEMYTLESRVASLERRIGSSVRSPIMSRSIADSIESMQKILSLLASDPEHLKSRIRNLNELSQLKVEPYIEKINWIYQRLKSLDEEIKILPHMVSRLQTLKTVHTEAINYKIVVDEITTAISQIQKDIDDWKSLIASLEEKLDLYTSTKENRNLQSDKEKS